MTSRDRRFELAVSRVLGLGVTAASLCLAAGLVAALAGSAGAVSSGLLAAGLLILMATPAARIVVAAVAYARGREWLFAGLTLVVLAELVASVVAAIQGR